MRIYRDLELVESLGSGVPRIIRAYGTDCFKFMNNFTRMIFPINQNIEIVTAQVTAQVERLLLIMNGEMDRESLQKALEISHREYFRLNYLIPALEAELIELTIPDKLKSCKQKYCLTQKGINLRDKI